MGASGPCGPCSELHYDRLGRGSVPELVNADDPTLIEVWNLVFMQYFREESGDLKPLPARHIDTGMGLERLASILQGKHSNYDTDVFMPIFGEIQRLTGAPAYEGKLGAEDVGGVDTAYRVIADHIRTLTFAITDGANPSKEGRGYVLRRILRRAVRVGKEVLNAPPHFFAALVPCVVEHFGEAFPELRKAQGRVTAVIQDEEASFSRTLKAGINHFKKIHARVAAEGGTVISGEDAFFLYDSMGFPVDLTGVMAEEVGMTVDTPGFEAAMAEQKARSAAAANKAGVQRLTLEAEQTAALAADGIAPTDDDAKYTWHAAPTATVKAIWTGETLLAPGEPATAAMGTVGVVLDTTSFYAESGGQKYDQGRLLAGAVAAPTEDADADADDVEVAVSVMDVNNAQSFAGFVLHIGTVAEGAEVKIGDTVTPAVDYDRRDLLAPNHTMTHVLNFALRRVLGPEVDQKGSEVAPDKLRFDFSHNAALTGEQLQAVEDIVRGQVADAMPVYSQLCSLAEARAIHSLRAVFGETYPDPVRVISVGQEIPAMLADPSNSAWSDFSIEFCGGTHLSNTAGAGDFCIIEEGSISKGIRRIIALTKDAATDALDAGESMADKYSAAKALTWQELEGQLVGLGKEVDETTMPAWRKVQLRAVHAELGKKVAAGNKAAAAEAGKATIAAGTAAIDAAVAAGDKWVSALIEADNKAATGLQKDFKKRYGKVTEGAVPYLGFTMNPGVGGKPGNFCVVTVVPAKMEAFAGFNAVEWAGAAAEALGAGKPRGKPDAASANGKLADGATAEAALAAANAYAATHLG